MLIDTVIYCDFCSEGEYDAKHHDACDAKHYANQQIGCQIILSIICQEGEIDILLIFWIDFL
jgi:hypothetical protein